MDSTASKGVFVGARDHACGLFADGGSFTQPIRAFRDPAVRTQPPARPRMSEEV